MRPAHRQVAGLLAAGALALTGCAQSVEPIERLGRKAVRSVTPKVREMRADARAAAPAPPVLTFDDGAERDPEFVQMVDELNLPIGMFLTDSVPAPGYDHFDRLRRAGGSLSKVRNHAAGHVYLPGLPYAAQRAQICGRQDRLEARFGNRPRLFRPPYGAYNNQTLRAAGDCGVDAVVLWGASMQINDLRYAHGDRLEDYL